MQEFLAAFAGSNIEALWQGQVNMRSALVPNADLSGFAQSNQQAIAQLEAQIQELVSQLAAATEPDQIALLEQQLTGQDSLLTIQIATQEAVYGKFEAQHMAAIATNLHCPREYMRNKPASNLRDIPTDLCFRSIGH